MKSLNIQRSGKGFQQGFTIIELVVVILLLGILAATALPRFIDVTDEAHDAVVDGVLGGLSTAMALYRAEYVGQGSVSSPAGYPGITASTSGYPNASDEATCLTAFNSLLQGGRPVAVDAGSTVATAGARSSRAGTEDIAVSYTADGSNTCVYTYVADVSVGSAGTKSVAVSMTTGDATRYD